MFVYMNLSCVFLEAERYMINVLKINCGLIPTTLSYQKYSSVISYNSVIVECVGFSIDSSYMKGEGKISLDDPLSVGKISIGQNPKRPPMTN